mmetsp:Transcript_507/g.960  ORF Transcript_507/g.960 Transcript_507/m.960 type:complete len:227 (+) Transcript_507:620-1300(+)
MEHRHGRHILVPIIRVNSVGTTPMGIQGTGQVRVTGMATPLLQDTVDQQIQGILDRRGGTHNPIFVVLLPQTRGIAARQAHGIRNQRKEMRSRNLDTPSQTRGIPHPKLVKIGGTAKDLILVTGDRTLTDPEICAPMILAMVPMMHMEIDDALLMNPKGVQNLTVAISGEIETTTTLEAIDHMNAGRRNRTIEWKSKRNLLEKRKSPPDWSMWTRKTVMRHPSNPR